VAKRDAASIGARLVAAGYPADQAVALARELARDAAAHDAMIARGVCPTCGAPLARTVDPRQVSAVALEGGQRWVQYRCSSPTGGGHVLLDRAETEGN
jgi:hypothetical protein